MATDNFNDAIIKKVCWLGQIQLRNIISAPASSVNKPDTKVGRESTSCQNFGNDNQNTVLQFFKLKKTCLVYNNNNNENATLNKLCLDEKREKNRVRQ